MNINGNAHLPAKWWELLLMFLFLSVSGNPFISKDEYKIFTLIVPAIYLIFNYKRTVSYRTILIFTFLLGYELIHAFIFKLDYSLTIIKIFIVLLLSAVVVDLLRDRFILVLTKTMVIISLVSFVFLTLSYIPGINTFLYNFADRLFHVEANFVGIRTPTLLLYTFSPEYFLGLLPYNRNPGIFWESGAFAVFLNITLFLHLNTKPVKRFKDLFDKDSTILVIAILTTTSTMGVIALIITLSFFSLQLRTGVKFLLVFAVLFSSYLIVTSVDFLGSKIERQLLESQKTNNRFGSAILDLKDFAERPVFGWSRRLEVLFGTTVYSYHTHRVNGLTYLLRAYGIVYFTVYFVLVFHSFKAIYSFHNPSYNFAIPLFGILLLWIVSFSELIYDIAFFKALIFLYPFYRASANQWITDTVDKPHFFQQSPSMSV
jgi:hypothetical protein